jgi:hypothetical protein
MGKSQQPNYAKSDNKFAARSAFIEAYRAFSGLPSIPADRDYVTLCFDLSEPRQLVQSKLITPSQFFGINFCRKLIEQITGECGHSDVNGCRFVYGDWNQALLRYKLNPALLYFDTVWRITNRELHVSVTSTMRLCPPATLLAVNTIVGGGRHGSDLKDTELGKAIASRFTTAQLADWTFPAEAYTYRTNKTDMRTYLLWRKP